MTKEHIKTPKKKGPIRFEAVIPITIVVVVIYLYFALFFDTHLRKTLEWAGYQALGAEVNIASIKTSFIKGTFELKGLELTSVQNPNHNALEVGDIRFSVLWDGLLRARLIVDEMAVEQIAVDTPRTHKGKIKPPEENKEDSNEPGAAEKLKDQALQKIEQDHQDNLMGDLAAVASGTSGDDQLKNIESSLKSKEMVAKLQSEFNSKSQAWQEKIKTLPQGKEIEELGARLSKVKTKDFKNIQELQQSLQQVDAIVKEADQKYKLIQSTGNDLSSDLKNFDQAIKDLDQQVKADIKSVEQRLKIPKLDSKSLSRYLFNQYAAPYMAKFEQYKGMADKYLPPNLLKKDKAQEAQIKPHPRAKGVTYEFGTPTAYPLFWVKKVVISSQANPAKMIGNVEGKITDITSNQVLINKPTVAQLRGDFPAQQIQGLTAKLTVDGRPDPNLIEILFNIASMPMEGKTLVDSGDVKIGFKKATQKVQVTAAVSGLKQVDLNIGNAIENVEYDVSAKDGFVSDLLQKSFAQVPRVTVDIGAKGDLPLPPLNITSNLGSELERAIREQLQKKIDEQRAKIEAMINESIGKERAKLEGDYNKLKAQIEGEVKKVTDQINKQKNVADSKVNEAKKDSENQGKKKVEDELNNLKKKFGL